MNVFKNINKIVKKIINFDSFSFIGNKNSPFTMVQDDGADIGLQLSYKDSLYISTALLKIKDAVSSVDFKLYKIVSTKGEAQEIVAHEILDLLYKPNPLQTKAEFMRILFVNIKLSGEAFIRLIREPNTGKIVSMVNILPSEISLRVNDDGTDIEYIWYDGKGIKHTFTNYDMIHIKDPDIVDQLRGYSVLRPLYARIMAELKSIDYQGNVFSRNGNPDTILWLEDGSHSQEDTDEIKAKFYNTFNGKNEKNKVSVISGKGRTEPLNKTSNLLDYKASLEMLRDDIHSALGVPKSLVTSDDVNRANADAGLRQFMQFTIVPMFKLLLDVLNERFVIPNYGEEFYLDTEKLLSEDKDLLFKEIETTVNGRIQIQTVNEVRTRLGLEPVEGADELSSPQDFTSYTLQNAFKGRSKLYKTLKASETLKIAQHKLKVKKTLSSPEFRVKYANAVDSVRERGVVKIHLETKKFFKEQKERALNKLKEAGDSFTTANDFFDVEKEKQETVKYILPLYVKIAEQSGNVALIPVKIFFTKQNDFVMTSSLLKKLEARANMFAKYVTEYTYNELSKVVGDNIETGVGKMATILEKSFLEMSKVRSERIARTESCFTTSIGTEMAFQESEFVEGKEWLAVIDDVTREEHVENDGQVVGKYETFSNGESFPGENSINCRCAIAPVVK